MIWNKVSNIFNLVNTNYLFFKVLLFCIILVFPTQIIAQEKNQNPPQKNPISFKDFHKTFNITESVPNLSGPKPIKMDVTPGNEISMEFNLEWTNYQAHRVNDAEPLDIILNGTISSNSSEIWTLSTFEPGPGLAPNLYFVEDVLGRSNQASGNSIGLIWEISLDGGAFQPMTVLPDNSISFTFPPGSHTFQVRIHGNLQYGQADGYYKLYLSQSIVPQL